MVNGAPQRFDESTSKDLVPCAPATTKALYAHDGGYASFGEFRNAINVIECNRGTKIHGIDVKECNRVDQNSWA